MGGNEDLRCYRKVFLLRHDSTPSSNNDFRSLRNCYGAGRSTEIFLMSQFEGGMLICGTLIWQGHKRHNDSDRLDSVREKISNANYGLK